MFVLKTFTFSLSKNTGLPTSFDVFLSFLLSLYVFSLCLDELPLRLWMKFPNVVKIPPNHVHRKTNVFFHIHEINTGSCVVY